VSDPTRTWAQFIRKEWVGLSCIVVAIVVIVLWIAHALHNPVPQS
jgi:hypothetical protein